jgi:CRISPR type III-B/RAMP module RAMP protein Cmr1
MDWVKVSCTVRTPLFTAGWPGRGQPILGSSVRGVLGFWLRAVVGSRVGNDLKSLANWQRRVLGDTQRQSPTVVRVTSASLSAGRMECPWPNDRGIVYLLGQGLFEPGKKPRDGQPGRPATVRPYLDPESGSEKRFTLRFRLPADEHAAELFWAALWCATNFGGLGARTRRGFGRFTVDIEPGAAPSWWADPAVFRPEDDSPGWIGLPERLRAVVDRTVEPAAEKQRLAEVPLYPRFDHRDNPGDDWFSAIADLPVPPEPSWRSCLNTLGLQMAAVPPVRNVQGGGAQVSAYSGVAGHSQSGVTARRPTPGPVPARHPGPASDVHRQERKPVGDGQPV